MIDQEPSLTAGVLHHRPEIKGCFHGGFVCDGTTTRGPFTARCEDGKISVSFESQPERLCGPRLKFRATDQSVFQLQNVIIGIGFHWQRDEDQTFTGDLSLIAHNDGTLTAVNHVRLEDYLASVISSEMRAEAPAQFLQAHAITSRSWLLAMLQRCGRQPTGAVVRQPPTDETQLIRWYDREDHADFDVCADDHCQRYQGITKIISTGVAAAVAATRGRFLTYQGQICDARFSKACGGRTETFETTWEEISLPYLASVADAPLGAGSAANLTAEAEAAAWILSRPETYCNTEDRELLQQVLPDFDQETTDFFRWTVQYQREELEAILRAKSGIDFGTLVDLVPVQRGPSGRLVRLRVQGSERSMIVGKELEIRRWLAHTHLYSSAFVPRIDRDDKGIPTQITLHGAGWGHGVGLCQIGAAVMAAGGRLCEEILRHYFPGSDVVRLY